MFFRIDPDNGVAIYDQIERQVVYAVAKEALRPGDLVPSVRELAVTLAVNPNTVAKVYRELEHEGVIELRHGAGAFVSGTARAKKVTDTLRAGQSVVSAAIKRLRDSGVTDEEIRRLFEAELAGQSRQSHQTHRVVPKRGGAHHAQRPPLQVVEPVVMIDELATAQREGKRIDGQIAPGEVLGQGAPLHRRQVDGERQRTAVDPPRPKRIRQRKPRRAVGRRELLSQAFRIGRDREIHVCHRTAEQRIAQSTTHDPPVAAHRRERGQQSFDRR